LLPQAARAAAAIRVAKTSDFFISRFLLWDEAFSEIVSSAEWPVLTRTQAFELLPFSFGL